MKPAVDGAICRVKLELGILSSDQAEAVAEVAETFGNGIIEATNRANLQLRGMELNHADEIVRQLLDVGLGPRVPEADHIRNVMVSPLAGRDPAQNMDARPLARKILETLQNTLAYRRLSPKFSILVDGGEAVAMVEHPHDIWLSAVTNRAVAIGLAGCPFSPSAIVPTDRAHDSIVALIDFFIEESKKRPDISRFRHLLPEASAAKILGTEHSAWQRPKPLKFGHIGAHRQRDGLIYTGGMPPLGRLDPPMLRKLARLGSAIHVTPWQSILIPDLAYPISDELEAIGLICDPSHTLASMIACSGSMGCASARANTLEDGRELAPELTPELTRIVGGIHLTGCEKSCAAAHVATNTFVASAPGRYDVYRRSDGAPSRFGTLLASSATLDDITALMRQRKFTESD